MKTPREILFDRHRSTESKLDAIRQDAVRGLIRAQSRQSLRETDSPGFSDSLRAFFLSLRWHLAGMSAVWLIAMFLNMDLSPSPTVSVAKHDVTTPRQLLASLQEYRRQLWLLMESPVSEPVSSPPRRSQRVPATAIA
jgi:hypothetical protein